MNRLNLWDFDGVLADSERVVSRLAHENPRVPYWKWWHDPELSARAALETEPIYPMWETLEAMEGRHAILTARCAHAVVTWLVARERDPRIGHLVKTFEGVISTSRTSEKGIPASVKKANLVEMILAGSNPDVERPVVEDVITNCLGVRPDVFVFDDRYENLYKIGLRCPGVELHLVNNGRIRPVDLSHYIQRPPL